MAPWGPEPLRFQPDQLYRVPTDDGSAVALGRYLPRGSRLFAEPVVLAHSLGTNRFNLDFDEKYSVARALARRGFEAWVLEVRGHGLGGSGEGSTFDVEASHDVGAALRTIQSTGASEVLWVGHSRGGLLAYAHLARNPAAPIRAVVTLGSPVTFSSSPGLKRFVSLVAPALDVGTVPLGFFARLAAPLGLIPPAPVGPYLLEADNVDPVVLKQALAHVVADVPQGVAAQFARWVRDDVFDGNDGFDYRRALASVRVPLLALAGPRDMLAAAPGVEAVKTLWGGPVETVLAGRAAGFSVDFGHGDLVLGRHAPDEVVPRIIDFLTRHATPS